MLQIDNEKYYRRSVVSTIKGRANDHKTREKIENFLKERSTWAILAWYNSKRVNKLTRTRGHALNIRYNPETSKIEFLKYNGHVCDRIYLETKKPGLFKKYKWKQFGFNDKNKVDLFVYCSWRGVEFLEKGQEGIIKQRVLNNNKKK